MNREETNIAHIYNHIHYYIEMVKNSNIPYYNSYYLELLRHEVNHLYQLNIYYINQLMGYRMMNQDNTKVFTKEQLSYYDGTNGKPAYVAVNGTVYDLSLEPTWGGGTHFRLYSGKDLTNQFNSCHAIKVLEKLPQVGTLIDGGDS